MDHLLTLIIFFPVVGATVAMLIPSSKGGPVKIVSAVTAFITFLLTIKLWVGFDSGTAEMQFVEQYPWITSFNIEYFLGIDGLSLPLILLTSLLGFIGVIASWGINKQVKGYFALFLLLETGMLGVFCALDFFQFYIFWEVVLLPMYFLIGIWGSPARKEGKITRGGPYAAMKFFLYTLFGSVLMLLAMLALYFYSDPHTFNMLELIHNNDFVGNAKILGLSFNLVVFVALFIGFAIKVPIFPFHTWLPDAHVEAPTAVSVILAGVLLKMGIYGMLRISYPILPQAAKWFAPTLAILGLINIVYGALVAMAQKDLKRLVAYSSISHMGFCLLGMAAITHAGMNGAVLQMFNHGIISAMLFLLVGVIYDRAHHRNVDGFGGLGTQMPIYTGITSLAFFASLGLPGLSGFISEALCFIGAFPVFKLITILATTGIVITAGYYLWALQRMFLGELNEKYKTLPEINGRELFTLVPLGIIVIILGVYPMPVLDMMDTTLDHLIKLVSP